MKIVLGLASIVIAMLACAPWAAPVELSEPSLMDYERAFPACRRVGVNLLESPAFDASDVSWEHPSHWSESRPPSVMEYMRWIEEQMSAREEEIYRLTGRRGGLLLAYQCLLRMGMVRSGIQGPSEFDLNFPD